MSKETKTVGEVLEFKLLGEEITQIQLRADIMKHAETEKQRYDLTLQLLKHEQSSYVKEIMRAKGHENLEGSFELKGTSLFFTPAPVPVSATPVEAELVKEPVGAAS